MLNEHNLSGAAPDPHVGLSPQLQAFIGRSQVLAGWAQLGEAAPGDVVEELVASLPRLSSAEEFDVARAVLLRAVSRLRTRSTSGDASRGFAGSSCDELDVIQQRILRIVEGDRPSATVSRQRARHKQAVRAMAAQISNAELRPANISSQLQISISHLGFLLHRYSGATFGKLLRRLRLTAARRLLSTTSDSIKEVAIKVGYRSTSPFDRHFKKESGVSPTEYRNKTYRA